MKVEIEAPESMRQREGRGGKSLKEAEADIVGGQR